MDHEGSPRPEGSMAGLQEVQGVPRDPLHTAEHWRASGKEVLEEEDWRHRVDDGTEQLGTFINTKDEGVVVFAYDAADSLDQACRKCALYKKAACRRIGCSSLFSIYLRPETYLTKKLTGEVE